MEIGNYNLIIDHQISPSGSSNLKGMTNYFAREGEHAIGGIDREITREDRELELRKEMRTLSDMVDYYSRSERFENRNPELPLVEGEQSGGCFSQDGLFDAKELPQILRDSGSHIIRSVVSVRREDAYEMKLSSKADFQHLLRETWQSQAEAWGIIQKEDIRWCAFFHTDNPKSLHCHVVTWDASGRFGGDAIPHIPTGRMDRGKEHLYREVNKDRIEHISRERGYLREYLLRSIDRECGREVGRERICRLEQLRDRCGSDLVFSRDREVSEKVVARALDNITQARPDERNLSYARSSERVREVADNTVRALRENSRDFNRAYERYEQLVTNVARLKGLTDLPIRENGRYINPAKAHYREAMDDLNTRLGNAVIKASRTDFLREAERSREVSQMRHELRERVESYGKPTREEEQQFVRSYERAVEREVGRELTEIERERTRNSASRTIKRACDRKERIDDYRLSRTQTRETIDQVSREIGLSRTANRRRRNLGRTLPFELRREIGRNIELGRAYLRSGRAEDSTKLARETAQKIISQPAIAQHIEREAERYEIAYRGDGRSRAECERETLSRIQTRCEQTLAERISKEMQHDRANENTLTRDDGLQLLGSFLNALSGTSPQAHATGRGMRSHTHRSRDAFRLRERDLDDTYSRGR